RVRRVLRLLKAAVVERVGVHDQRASGREIADVRLERRRVHGDENVGRVARREDVVVGEVELETRDTEEGPCRSADLRREVRKRREVVAEDGGGVREPVSGDLHAVTGVTREADDYLLDLLDGLHHCAGPTEKRSGPRCPGRRVSIVVLMTLDVGRYARDPSFEKLERQMDDLM